MSAQAIIIPISTASMIMRWHNENEKWAGNHQSHKHILEAVGYSTTAGYEFIVNCAFDIKLSYDWCTSSYYLKSYGYDALKRIEAFLEFCRTRKKHKQKPHDYLSDRRMFGHRPFN